MIFINMRQFKIIYILLLVIIFNSCGLHKNLKSNESHLDDLVNQDYNAQNYREYKEQELIYYKYTLERKKDIRKGEEKKPKKSEETEVISNTKQKEVLINVIESKGIKPPKFIEVIINKRSNIDSVNINEELPTIENIDESTKSNFKHKLKAISSLTLRFVSYTYFILLAIFNFPLFVIVFPTTICAIGCICYPIWWKRGYLDTPYAKIATFIAAYGGLLANILWIILYL
jgi:hypothetical protein